MLIKVKSSKLFSTSPAMRFANKYLVSQDMWTELWKRYKVLGYTHPELAEYFHIKTGKKISRRSVKRWIFLTNIYLLSKPARDMGAEVINTEMFGVLEKDVVYEVTRHMKSGSTTNSRIMA